MSRTRGIPSYRPHRQSGQAVVTLPDATGKRRDHLLGKYGSPESHAEYARVIAEWQANARRVGERARTDLTVAELLNAFWDHAVQHYRRPDGTSTSELGNFKLALRPLKALYAHTLAADFGPVALRTVRDRMIEDGRAGRVVACGRKHDRTIAEATTRRTINKWVNRLRHVFKWGASLELVPVSVYESLRTVPALAAGRSKARDPEPVKPVPDAHIEPVLRTMSGSTSTTRRSTEVLKRRA